jgi:hypothetical protein
MISMHGASASLQLVAFLSPKVKLHVQRGMNISTRGLRFPPSLDYQAQRTARRFLQLHLLLICLQRLRDLRDFVVKETAKQAGRLFNSAGQTGETPACAAEAVSARRRPVLRVRCSLRLGGEIAM